ncbi:hypothetical protein BGZ65_010706, partial [Modicella reniformis]
MYANKIYLDRHMEEEVVNMGLVSDDQLLLDDESDFNMSQNHPDRISVSSEQTLADLNGVRRRGLQDSRLQEAH